MNRLRSNEEETRRKYLNLKKSAHRPRTLQGTLQKSENWKDLRNEYKQVLKCFEYRLSSKDWEVEVINWDKLKQIFEACQNILDKSKILPCFKSIAKTAIICKRLAKSHN